jgi:hypothetical protein
MENVPRSAVSGNLLVTLYFASKFIPMIVSAFTIYLGFKLFVLGVTGQASIVVDATRISAQLLNAAPGLFFAIGGLIALVIAVWKGSSFTFSRQDPLETWALCLPGTEARQLRERLNRRAAEVPEER